MTEFKSYSSYSISIQVEWHHWMLVSCDVFAGQRWLMSFEWFFLYNALIFEIFFFTYINNQTRDTGKLECLEFILLVIRTISWSTFCFCEARMRGRKVMKIMYTSKVSQCLDIHVLYMPFNSSFSAKKWKQFNNKGRMSQYYLYSVHYKCLKRPQGYSV